MRAYLKSFESQIISIQTQTELIHTFRDGLNFYEGILNVQVATSAIMSQRLCSLIQDCSLYISVAKESESQEKHVK